MQTCCLPIGDFELVEMPLSELLQTPEDSPYGFIVEVDLEYPPELHDIQSDYPLAPTRESVEVIWLSQYQENLREKMNIRVSTKSKKLLQTMFAKPHYTLHYLTLQLYSELGLKVTKVHRVLRFLQGFWLAPYIELNSRKREQATNKFDENFFKLRINSVYGKMCENPRKRTNVMLVRSEKELLEQSSKFNFKSFKIFNPNLAAVTLRRTKFTWSKPLIIGATILDLSKMFMFRFHYKIMKENFACKLLYSDTDSLTYAIMTEDLYADLKNNPTLSKEFDFSNYPKESSLYNPTNKKKVLKFKDELAGSIMTEFVGIKSKMYSIITAGMFFQLFYLSKKTLQLCSLKF